MSTTKLTLDLIVTLAVCALAPAIAGADGALRVGDAWARATPPGVTTGAAYCKIFGGGDADRLIGAHSAAARAVEVHATTKAGNGVVEMRAVDALAVAAGATVELASGGAHLMLVGIAAPLTAGTTIELTLVFEKAGEIRVAVPVIDARAQPLPAATHEQHAH